MSALADKRRAFESSIYDRSVIKENTYVSVHLPSENLKLVLLVPGSTISLGKFGSFKVDQIVGESFGQYFEVVSNDGDVKVSGSKTLANDDNSESEEGETVGFSEHNKNLLNLGDAAQKLTMKEIEELKMKNMAEGEGDAGRKIISKVIESHKAFDKKTLQSQDKYVKRKEQKFLRRFQVEFLDTNELLGYMLFKEPARVLDISIETLALMMSLANVHSGGKYLVVDDTTGIVTLAMMERMNGSGSIVLAHESEHPNLSLLKYYNNGVGISVNSSDTKTFPDMLKTINWLQFFEGDAQKEYVEEIPEEELQEMKQSKRQQYYRKKRRADNLNATIDTVKEGNFDGVIVASTIHLPSLVPCLVDYIGGSRPLVVYSQYKELLVELAHHFQYESSDSNYLGDETRDLRLLGTTILESRARPYQTIPGRLHPVMSMRGGGGYVFSATRVYPSTVTAVGRGSRGKKERAKKQKVEESST